VFMVWLYCDRHSDDETRLFKAIHKTER
jgi:hypothetical protein